MKIIVYCRNDDPYSQMIKNLLSMNDIPFENREVTRDKAAYEEMYKLSGQSGTPVLVINGRAYSGFDREMIKKIIETEIKQEQPSVEEPKDEPTA